MPSLRGQVVARLQGAVLAVRGAVVRPPAAPGCAVNARRRESLGGLLVIAGAADRASEEATCPPS